MIKLKHFFFFPLLKWIMTWAIALISIGVVFLKSPFHEDGFNPQEIWEKGELYLVCIVMLSDSLVEIILNVRKKNALNIVLMCIFILTVLICGFQYILSLQAKDINDHYVVETLGERSISFWIYSFFLGLVSIWNNALIEYAHSSDTAMMAGN